VEADDFTWEKKATPGLLDALAFDLELDKLEEDTVKTLLELVKKLVMPWQPSTERRVLVNKLQMLVGVTHRLDTSS